MLSDGKKHDDDAMKKMGEQMQKLSEMIGQLQKQLAEKTAEANDLRTQLSKSSGSDVALKEAQAQVATLRTQVSELQAAAQKQAASAVAAASAGASSAAPQASTPVAGSTMKQTLDEASVAPSGLAVGATAFVMRAGGLPLRLRAGPSLDQEILDRLQPGSSLTVLEGPQQGSGHAWWRVRTIEGREGWVAGENLLTQPD